MTYKEMLGSFPEVSQGEAVKSKCNSLGQSSPKIFGVDLQSQRLLS